MRRRAGYARLLRDPRWMHTTAATRARRARVPPYAGHAATTHQSRPGAGSTVADTASDAHGAKATRSACIEYPRGPGCRAGMSLDLDLFSLLLCCCYLSHTPRARGAARARGVIGFLSRCRLRCRWFTIFSIFLKLNLERPTRLDARRGCVSQRHEVRLVTGLAPGELF